MKEYQDEVSDGGDGGDVRVGDSNGDGDGGGGRRMAQPHCPVTSISGGF